MKRYHIKSIGGLLLISINVVIFAQEKMKKKKEKNVQTGTQSTMWD